MKTLKSIILGCAAMLALSLTSCEDWLNVNVDPENPTSESATYENRLAHIEFYTNHAVQIAAWRTSLGMGDWTRVYNTGNNYWLSSIWCPVQGLVTTPYQWWYVGAACNIDDMYNKAMAAGAYHYAGAAKLIRGYGFMMMADLYGEMPYTEGLGEDATPAYDNGKTIYLGCFADIDEAIELFQQSQDATLPSLAVGDWWLQGDTNKWLKLAYLLKARWCNKLNKKQAGSYLDGKYDVATIKECLSKAMQSVADDAAVNHTNDNGATQDVLGWGEPVDWSTLYSISGGNSANYITKLLYDNLTNFAGYGVEDPRADKIIPWTYSQQGPDSPAEVKFVGNWRRSLGVDMISGTSPSLSGGPLAPSFTQGRGWWINTTNEERLGDTIYVEARSGSRFYGNTDLYYRKDGTDASRHSGTFYTRVSAPTYLGTYAEACFIKAEILFNEGDKNGAFTAYKDGIKASIDAMNSKLSVWRAEYESARSCPAFTEMTQEDINNFLANGIGTAADITLGKILTQKRIALHFSVEIWNDMRRYDFNKDYFLGWDIPAQHAINESAQKAIPNGKQYRRWRHCSHELNYNAENLHAIGEQVPGANMSLDQWNNADDAWTINVWWDSDQQ